MLHRRLLAVVALTALSFVASPVVAQERGAPTVRELQHAYDEAVAEEAEALANWELGVLVLEDLQRQVDEARSAVSYVEGLLVEGERLLDEARAARDEGERQLARRQAELASEEELLAAQAVEAFMGGTRPEDVAFRVAMQAESATDIQSGTEYSAIVLDDQRVTVERVTELREAADAAARELERLRAEAETTRDAVDSYRRDLTAQRIELEDLEAQVSTEVDRLAQVLAEVQARRTSYEARLQALERDSDGVAQLLRARQLEQPPAEIVPVLRSPIESATVSSGFGQRVHPIFGDVRHHNGLDIHAAMGQEIRAAGAGVVAMAEERVGFGLVTVIDHGGQVATLYAHQSQLGVRPGDVVERAQVIGRVGSTGYSTAPHLHFEIRLLGLPVDPLPHVDFDEPLPGTCEALRTSTDPADIEELARREDCTPDA